MEIFKDSLRAGKVGESIFLSLLETAGVRDVKDVSDDKVYQKLGIDFLVAGKKIDIKFDVKAASTGNIAFETVSQQKNGVVIKEGWTKTSSADIILYITFSLDSVYFLAFDLPGIHELMKSHGKGERIVKNYGYESVIIPVATEDCISRSTSFSCRIGREYDELELHTFVSGLLSKEEAL